MSEYEMCWKCRESLPNQKMTNKPGVVLCPRHALVDQLAEALRRLVNYHSTAALCQCPSCRLIRDYGRLKEESND